MATFSGKQALIIGGSSGVGEATVFRLAAQEARVVAVGRSLPALERVRDKAGGRVQVRGLDATDGPAVDALIGELDPDLIVLSAGVRPTQGTVDQHSWESFSEAWNQDVRMAFEIGQSALRRPLRPGSSVVIVSSGAGLVGSPVSGGYLQGVADEKKLGIRFVAIVPKQLIAGTRIAELASTTYAARAGITPAKYMERFEVPLSPDGVAQAILGVAGGEIAPGATVVGVSGKGTEVL
jgi:NAD(P)-dependent dehydrogenase (short-subunit alcohol dehydrogenase family)